MIAKGKVHIAIDGQWGSSGKGKLYGYVYNRFPLVDVACADFMPNAGHTYVQGDVKIITKQLPMGAFFKTVKTVYLGPQSVIDMQRLVMEVNQAYSMRGPFNLLIHPNASILNPNDASEEIKDGLSHISSTMQGVSQAVIRKIRRISSETQGFPVIFRDFYTQVACDNKQSPFVTGCVLNPLGYYHPLIRNHTVFVETAQGFDLSLDWGTEWPYVTSRDCLLGRVMDNIGLSPMAGLVHSVIGCIRTFPIRVGNTSDGNSGPCYLDQREISWDDISANVGSPVIERTTVTKRIRRVFTFSMTQLQRFLQHVRPNYLFVNFVNYLSPLVHDDFIRELKALTRSYGISDERIIWGTGADNSDITEPVCKNE